MSELERPPKLPSLNPKLEKLLFTPNPSAPVEIVNGLALAISNLSISEGGAPAGFGKPGKLGGSAIILTVPYTVRAVVLVAVALRIPVIWLFP